mgnify:CR=1 FL=1
MEIFPLLLQIQSVVLHLAALRRQIPGAVRHFLHGRAQEGVANIVRCSFLCPRPRIARIARLHRFLHVYHHVLLVWAWWSVLVVCPGERSMHFLALHLMCVDFALNEGGDAYFGASINSFIHVIMYRCVPSLACRFPRYLEYFYCLQLLLDELARLPLLLQELHHNGSGLISSPQTRSMRASLADDPIRDLRLALVLRLVSARLLLLALITRAHCAATRSM